MAVAATVGIVASGALIASCGCAGVGCASAMAFVVHIPIDRPGLDQSTITVCRQGQCMNGTPTWIDRSSDPGLPTGGWEDAYVTFAGAIQGKGSIEVTPDGRATLDVTVWVSSQAARDGDLYSLRVVAFDGMTLIDFSRQLGYTYHDYGCGLTCASGTVEVWPSSTNGLVCTSRARTSGASYISPGLTLPNNQAQGTTFDVCRDSTCSRSIWPRNVFDGALGVTLAGGINPGANTFAFQLYIDDDPAVLADGDVYTVTITDADQNVVATVDQAVTYQETFPDGPACDAFPTRQVTLAP
jgi:hypothetical protein